jgi:hypothetical protein
MRDNGFAAELRARSDPLRAVEKRLQEYLTKRVLVFRGDSAIELTCEQGGFIIGEVAPSRSGTQARQGTRA